MGKCERRIILVMTAEPALEPIPDPLRKTLPTGARIVAYRCRSHQIFRILWPEVDAPLVHPCPECQDTALRLIGTRPDSA